MSQFDSPPTMSIMCRAPRLAVRSAWRGRPDSSSNRSPAPSIQTPGLALAPPAPPAPWLHAFAISMAAWWLSCAALSNSSVTGMGIDVPSRANARHRSRVGVGELPGTKDPMLEII